MCKVKGKIKRNSIANLICPFRIDGQSLSAFSFPESSERGRERRGDNWKRSYYFLRGEKVYLHYTTIVHSP
jgi:hypothetical protein